MRLTVTNYLFGTLIGLAALTQAAQAWTCRNEDMEISCNNGKCEKADAHTPMSVSLDERGKLSACAYSGCWEGRAQVLRKDGGFLYAAGSYRFSTSQSKERTKVAIAIDRQARVGFVLVSSFAHPMTCTP